MTAQRVCRCGHFAEAHAHFRRGSECSRRECGCSRLRVKWQPKPGGALWTLGRFAELVRQIR